MSLDTRDLHVRRKIYPAKSVKPDHAHESTTIFIPLAGAIEEAIEGDTVDLSPGRILLMGPGVIHKDEVKAVTAEGVLIEAPPAVFREFLEPMGGKWLLVVDSQGIGPEVWRECQAGGAPSLYAIHGLILQVLANGLRLPTDRERSLIGRAIDFIDRNIRRPIGTRDIARRLQVEPEKISIAFREMHGCSVPQYIRRRRVHYATDELITTTSTLGEIAEKAGFADQADFSRIFKNLIGVSPLAFRRHARRIVFHSDHEAEAAAPAPDAEKSFKNGASSS